MKAFYTHPVLSKYCDPDAIEKSLSAIVDRMMPRMPSKLAQPVDTGLRLKVKNKMSTKMKEVNEIKVETKTRTQVQLRAKVHGDRFYS